MIRRLLLFFVVYAWTVTAAHATDAFQKNNPDIQKYEFARSYISALSYVKDIDDRVAQNNPEKLFPGQPIKIIKVNINELAMDNADLRILKDYLTKYLDSPNALIRNVAGMVGAASQAEITVNDQEKLLWEKWGDLNYAGQATPAKQVNFDKAQHTLALKRKEADKRIIQASVLMTKVLMSEKNPNGRGHRLAITVKQRQKLLDKLDAYGSDTLDWGLKPGQTTLEASIAVIREILEDSIWVCSDEK